MNKTAMIALAIAICLAGAFFLTATATGHADIAAPITLQQVESTESGELDSAFYETGSEANDRRLHKWQKIAVAVKVWTLVICIIAIPILSLILIVYFIYRDIILPIRSRLLRGPSIRER